MRRWWPLKHQDSKPTRICSYSLILSAQGRRNKYQFYSLWLYLIRAWTHNLLHLRQPSTSLHHRCGSTLYIVVLEFSNWAIVVNTNNIYSYMMVTTSYIWWEDDDLFVLRPILYRASTLEQHYPSTCRHVALLGHIILVPSQPVFALSP